MSQILTDEEITLIVRECARGSSINRDGSTSHRIARAIEAAVINKLNSAEPVGEVLWFDPSLQESPEKAGLIVDGYMSFMDKAKIGDRLYLHPPAPSAVDVENFKLKSLLTEARATLEMWKDVAPAVSLCADIDAMLSTARSEE